MLIVNEIGGGYPNKKILNNISFSLLPGEILCVMGPNGSGKSTLFKLLLGFLPLEDGAIYLDGKSSTHFSQKEYARHIAYIPQGHNPTFDYSVFDMVLMGRTCHLSSFKSPSSIDHEATRMALSLLNIAHLAEHNYTKLSGGQRQLVLIARAICQDSKLLIMDEPTANLDYANQQLILQTISMLAGKGYSIILSTHSPEQPFAIGSKVLLLKNGTTLGYGSPLKVLTSEMLEILFDIPMDIISVVDRYDQQHHLCLPIAKIG